VVLFEQGVDWAFVDSSGVGLNFCWGDFGLKPVLVGGAILAQIGPQACGHAGELGGRVDEGPRWPGVGSSWQRHGACLRWRAARVAEPVEVVVRR
jgi:hypothetical protein